MKSINRTAHFSPIRMVLTIAMFIVLAACGVDVDPNAGKGATIRMPNSSPVEMPKELRAAYIASVQSAAQESYAIKRLGNRFRLANSQQRFSATIDENGLAINPASGQFHFSMNTVGVGCEGGIIPVANGAVEAQANRVDVNHDGLTEWYVNGPLGVEQGFVLPKAPACTGPKRIVMAVESDLTAVLDDNDDGDGLGDAVRFVDAEGHQALSYTDLSVIDATGKTIPAWLSVDAGNLAIVLNDAGAAYPLAIDPLVWGQQAKLLASDATADDYFGGSVAIWGDTALIGAGAADVGANINQGAAYVFVRNGSTWTEQAKLVASDGAAGDIFGISTLLSSDTALIGARAADVGATSSAGAVYVFTRNGSTWTEQAKLVASDGASQDGFGISLSLSGDTALVGATYKMIGMNKLQGAAYVFMRNGSTWTEQAKLVASDGGAYNYFGWSVALSGDTALVAANARDRVYVFERNGATWTEQPTKLVASDGVPGDYFGTSMAFSGDTLLVGAPDSHQVVGIPFQGAAYVFVRSGSTWAEQAKLVASDAAPYDNFASSVSLLGDVALIGARSTDVGTNKDQGSVYVFGRNNTTWTEQTKLVPSDGWLDQDFGRSIAMSGDTAFVGSRQLSLAGPSGPGAAYVFVLRQANSDGCEVAEDCVSGFCVDGVCCDAECGNGDPTDCLACTVAAGAMMDGTCAILSMGTECRASAQTCDVAESCNGTSETCPIDETAPDGTVCPDGTCSGGVCTMDGVGGASGSSSSSSSSSGSGGGPIGPETGDGCACQTNSNTSPLSGSLAILGFALLVFRRRES